MAVNTLVVMFDDLTSEVFNRGFGRSLEDYDSTLDKLLREGRSYPNFYCGPLCTPSRVSLLTGLYPHNHGVIANGGAEGGWLRFVELGLTEVSLGPGLQQGGVRTGFAGKYLNGYHKDSSLDDIDKGWDMWAVRLSKEYRRFRINFNGRSKLLRGYDTTELAKLADRFIWAPRPEPWCLVLGVRVPHGPLEPKAQHAGAHDGVELKHPRSFNEANPGKPAYVRAQPLRDHQQQRAVIRAKLDMTLAGDELLARLVAVLEATGQRHRTVMIVTTDNGFEHGTHRLVRKGHPYAESSGGPLLIAGTGFSPGVDDRFAGMPDLTATIYDVMGVAPPHELDGVSLLDDNPPLGAYIEQLAPVPAIPAPAFRAVRSGRWVAHLYPETGETEFYDLAADPYQLKSKPPPAWIMARLQQLSEARGAACVDALRLGWKPR